MTQLEAIRTLCNIWGSPSVIGHHDISRIEAVAQPGETLLSAVARVAEVNVAGVRPFDFMRIRALCFERECRPAVSR